MLDAIQRRWTGNTSLIVRGFGGRGQTSGRAVEAGRIAKDTLLFGRLGLANIGQKSRMGSATLGVVGPRLFEAELAVDGEANFRGVIVFLTVVLPPADRAKLERFGRFQSFISTAGATKADFNGGTHTEMDGKCREWDYRGAVYGFELKNIQARPANSRVSV
jgi:hypothetical protein